MESFVRERDTKTLERVFPGESQMARLMRSFDWARTELSAPENWPETLRTAVRICLASRHPIVLWWGRSTFTQFYNDAYISFLGAAKHPTFLGRSGQECWSEIWPTMWPMWERVFATGEASWCEDFLYVLNRNLPHEEGYFNFSYSPLRDDAGTVEGIFCACYETTGRVIGERRLRTLRDLGRTVAEAKTAEAACELTAKTLASNPADIPFALIYLLERGAGQARLVAGTGVEAGSVAAPRCIDLSGAASDSNWRLRRVLETCSAELISNLPTRFERLPGGCWPESPETAIVLPIAAGGQSRPTGFLVTAFSPRRIADADYRTFFDLVAGHVATAVANARAYEEERKRAEALAEIDRAKTAFFGNVSHEFRTPLTLILGPLEDTLAAREGLAADQRKRLEVAHRNSLRLRKLVNTLLDFSRIEAGRIDASYEPTDLPALTAELASVFRSAIERAGLRFVINCPPIAESVYVDREMWEKIVLNLLSNAFKFSFTGEIEVSVREIDGAAELAVRDTGTGIPVQDLPHLFERFYRVKGAHGRTFEGSGIGLALVQELAKLHGGTLRVDSEVDRGSTFTVSVPLGKDHLPADRVEATRTLASTGLCGEAYVEEALRWLPDAPNNPDDVQVDHLLTSSDLLARAPQNREQRSRVLLADDNADMREYVERLLRNQYEVIAVSDGKSALASARQHRPDLILADVMMPQLDGFGLLREVRADQELKRIPVILLSGRAGEESRVEGLDAGASDYLVKPFSARELLARVGSQVALARLRSEAGEVERLLAAIVDSSDDAIVSKRLDGIITSWNKSAQRLFGYTASEAIGQHITLIIPPDRWKEEELILDKLRRGERVDHFETVRVRKDGTTVDLSLTISPIKDAAGRVVGASKVARDISDRKRAEQALRQSEHRFRTLSETLDVQVRARTKELEKRNADVLRQSEQLRDLSRRLLQAQDEERRHIARELHDSAGQTLTVLGINLAQLAQGAQTLSPQFAKYLEDGQQLVQQLHQEIRTMSYLLHPPLLDESGLPSALSWYIDGLRQRSDLDARLSIAEQFERLPRDLELVVFRLVQECLTNIHRHSGSKTAFIHVNREAETVCVEVEDEGKGMSAARLAEIQTRGSGIGIRGMHERVQQFHGTMHIESTGSGTRISATIPIPKNAVAEKDDPLQAAV